MNANHKLDPLFGSVYYSSGWICISRTCITAQKTSEDPCWLTTRRSTRLPRSNFVIEALHQLRACCGGCVAVLFQYPPLFPSTTTIVCAIYTTRAMLITSDKEERPLSTIPPLEVELNTYGFPRGYFMLRSLGTDRVLDVCQGLIADGTAIILWPSTESSLVECEHTP